jgi:hypothetical protein
MNTDHGVQTSIYRTGRAYAALQCLEHSSTSPTTLHRRPEALPCNTR